MKDYDISMPDDLNAALVKQSLDTHRKLWRATEVDHSWFAVAGMVMAAALLAFGMFAGEDSQNDQFFSLGCILILLQFQLYFVQSQKKAVANLLKRLEQRVTRLEQKTYPD